jgi:hypothetical protein
MNGDHIAKCVYRNIYGENMAYRLEWKDGYEDISQKAKTAI